MGAMSPRTVVLVLLCVLSGIQCAAGGERPPGPEPGPRVGDEARPARREPGPGLAGVEACAENLIPNSDLDRDADGDGIPDGWVPGNSPSLFRDSSVGCRAVGKGEGGGRALWIVGGRDLAGEWTVPLDPVQAGRTYLLSFSLYRQDFRNGWYPEVEVLGRRLFLNHHTSYRNWQRVELLVTAPEDLSGSGWFRFLNRYPNRIWVSGPSLRPYRLGGMWAGYTRNGVELRWEESGSDLVLEMELSVEDARGEVSRSRFLNLEAVAAWERLRGDLEDAGDGSSHDACFQRGLAWAPLKGAPPFRVRLRTLFQGKTIAEAAYTLKRRGSRDDKRDLTGTPPRLGSSPSLPEGFFPIGLFDVPPEAVRGVAAAGFNAALLRLPVPAAPSPGESGDAAAFPPALLQDTQEASLRWMLSALHGRLRLSPEELRGLAGQAGELKIAGKRFLCLFAADEPELSGVSPRALYGYRTSLQRLFPGVPAAAAVIRTWLLPYYRYCADWFLIDPYPVPHQPLTWMSDSLDAAGEVLGGRRSMAVVQAFGGESLTGQGWDRYPTLDEMRSLAFLALVHGARGLFFYNYPSAAASEEHWGIVQRVVRDLNQVVPWIVNPASDRCPAPWVLSPEGWRREPGRVHSAWFPGPRGDDGALVVVNPSSRPVDVRFEGLWGEKDELIQERLGGRPLVLKRGCLVDSLPPQGVSVYADVSP